MPKNRKGRPAPDEGLLKNWNELNGALMGFDEDQVRHLLDAEKAGRGRSAVLLRLQSRLNRLRRERERRELVAGSKS